MLKSLRRVFVQFSPTDPRATAARELLQRVGSSAARTSNPDCVVEYKVQEETSTSSSGSGGDGSHGRAVVELQFTDNESHKLFTADMKLADILKLIKQKTTEMEMRSVFKDVGFDPFAAAASSSSSQQQRQQQSSGGSSRGGKR